MGLRLNEDSFRKLISGQTRGAVAGVLRFLLVVVSLFYGGVVRFRNFLYCKKWFKVHRSGAAVISVGNITTGGTGKTPVVIWICNLLKEKGVLCGILTRGYKTNKESILETESCGDEPAVLVKSCPDARLVINSDRVEGANDAVNLFGVKALVLDDGFQHRRLGRDLDIVTIDATNPFGYGKILPAGFLREPVSCLARASAVIITRCGQVKEDALGDIEKKLLAINPDLTIAKSLHCPVCAESSGGDEINLEELKGKRVFAFCGIGNPDSFFNTVRGLGAELVGSRIYNDHYHYMDKCLKTIYEQAHGCGADLILTTEKDWTKISLSEWAKKDIAFAYLQIKLQFSAGEAQIRGLIDEALAGKMA
ncbi:MAG: tetraacyldisaccharide 4'-kinase [Planctomycetes bacterium]|nr:tetraacyldisaccharide 4'-kinase [Planctomycetota bacterium]